MNSKLVPIVISALFVFFGFSIGVGGISYINQKPNITENKTQSQSITAVKDESAANTSQNTDEYVVQKGDTLFGISVKYNVTMEDILKANNLQNADQIKAGQKLKIPGATMTNPQNDLTIDPEKMKEIQALVDLGNQPWRLDPVEVTKTDAPPSYEFNAQDNYTLKSKDDVKGIAQVEVKKKKGEKTVSYLVNLIQPQTKGAKGIWAINNIK